MGWETDRVRVQQRKTKSGLGLFHSGILDFGQVALLRRSIRRRTLTPMATWDDVRALALALPETS